MLKKLFFREYKHFWSLNQQGRAFFITVLLFDFLSPIYLIFIDAFLWRQTQDINILILYNITIFSLLPVGYYINGHLLKKFSIKQMYFNGALFKALALATLLLFSTVNATVVFLFGICYGISLGIFWSNRNLLHLELTKSSNRIYFSSLDFLSRTLSQIVVPAVIGYILVFGTHFNLYTTVQGYYLVGIGTVLLTILFGHVVKKIHAPAAPLYQLKLTGKTPKWNYARAILLLVGLFQGIYFFVPTVMVLTLVGDEDSLGVIQSIAAILAGVIIYTIARSINTRHRVRVIQASVLFSVFGALCVSIFYAPAGIFAFIAILAIAQAILLTECSALVFDLIDKENKTVNNRYAYIFDYELFLNFGRVVSILLFLSYIHMFSMEFALRFTPLIFTLSLILIAFFAKAALQPDDTPLANKDVTQVYEPTTAHTEK